MREMAGLLGASPSCGPVLRGLPAALEGLGPRRPQAPAHALAGAAARFRHPGNAAGELCWPPGAGPGGVHPGARKRGGGQQRVYCGESWRRTRRARWGALRDKARPSLGPGRGHRAAVAARRRPAVPPPGRRTGQPSSTLRAPSSGPGRPVPARAGSSRS